jgi:hypothetical protein
LIGTAPAEEPAAESIADTSDTTIQALVVQAEAFVDPGLSDLDIWTACVPDAATLIAKEVDGTITPVEDAALDALRKICAEEGIPLDGPPPPPPVSRTVYVNGPSAAPAPPAPAAPPTAAATDDATTTMTAADSTGSTSTTAPPTTSGSTTNTTTGATTAAAGETQYLSAHADAVAKIDEAVAANGKADKISEARQQLAEGEAKASNNDFWGALEKALEAQKNAEEAISEAGG